MYHHLILVLMLQAFISSGYHEKKNYSSVKGLIRHKHLSKIIIFSWYHLKTGKGNQISDNMCLMGFFKLLSFPASSGTITCVSAVGLYHCFDPGFNPILSVSIKPAVNKWFYCHICLVERYTGQTKHSKLFPLEDCIGLLSIQRYPP